MNLLADESVDGPIVDRLRSDGHHVLFIAELSPGIADAEVLARSRETEALLITADKDFGELVYRQRLVHAGVLLIRLAGLAPAAKATLVSTVLQTHSDEIQQSFAVLTERALRVRRR